MRNRFFVRVLNIGLIGLGFLLMDELQALESHPLGMTCSSCHLVKGTINQHNAKMLVSSQEVLCKSCHKNAITASHPSGFKPSKAPPEHFPLDWKGDLTCSTCHTIHSGERGLPRVEQSGKALCLLCHDKSFFAKMKDSGVSIMVSGHLDTRTSLEGDIDNFSIQCMACHESLADNLNVRMSANLMRHSSERVNHPIGMKYNTSMRYGGYRAVNMLPAKVSLPDGKISCISCHQGYSDPHGDLVVDNVGEKLCYSCHDM